MTVNIFGILFMLAGCSQNATVDVPLGRVTDYRQDPAQALAKGSPAPDFQFTNADGQTLLFSSLKDKVVLVNFWAVSCPYCVKEMPLIQQAYQALRDKGLVVLAINTGETESTVTKFLSKRGLTFDVILDPDVYVSTVYQAHYLPTTYIIDKTGIIVEGKIGAFTNMTEIISAVEPYLD